MSANSNRATLSAAFARLRSRARQQRRAREWFAASNARRYARLTRAAFDALARKSRSRAAEAAVAAVRCRNGLAAWRRAAALGQTARAFRWRWTRARALGFLRRWREGVDGGRGWEGIEERRALEWRLALFRERRAKRVVLRSWRGAVEAAAWREGGRGAKPESSAWKCAARGGGGDGRKRSVHRRSVVGDDELTPCREWGARLRTAEVMGFAHTVVSGVLCVFCFCAWRFSGEMTPHFFFLAAVCGYGSFLVGVFPRTHDIPHPTKKE